jgi:hypothetical protein
MSGVYQPDSGLLRVNGQAVHLGTPHGAQAAGVSAVHQELNMQPYLSIAENIFLGRQPYGRFGLIDFRQLNRMATDLLHWLGAVLLRRRADPPDLHRMECRHPAPARARRPAACGLHPMPHMPPDSAVAARADRLLQYVK